MSRGVLFIHNNFPGQFGDLAQLLLNRGVPCIAVAQGHAPGLEGVRMARYSLPRGTTPGIYDLATRAEADLLRARSAYDGAMALKAEGWDPAVIVCHPGWGEMTFMSEVFPKAKRVAFAEFYYHGRGYDVGFDTDLHGEVELDAVLRANAKNGAMAMAYADADAIVCPTPFQASTLPRRFQDGVRIFHEGVDLEVIRPAPPAPFTLDDGRVIAPGTPVITHVNNHMEPMRGLHILARALPRLMAEAPDAQVILIGDPNRKPYGAAAPAGKTWQQACFEGVDYDPARVHFLGRVPHARMLEALRLGVAHVYYTYPFVLSWSLSEAMASGCYVLGSDTPPVRDAIRDGENGRLLPFFEHDALASAMIDACRDPQSKAPLRAEARRTAEAMFSRAKGREAWLSLLRELGVQIPR